MRPELCLFRRQKGLLYRTVKDGLMRNSNALPHNPDYIGIIEVSSAKACREALEVLDYLGVDNLTVRVRK